MNQKSIELSENFGNLRTWITRLVFFSWIVHDSPLEQVASTKFRVPLGSNESEMLGMKSVNLDLKQALVESHWDPLKYFIVIFHSASIQFSSDQSLSPVQFFVTPWTTENRSSLSITNSRILLKLIHRVNDAIQTSHPLLSPSPSTFNLFQHQGLFQGVSSSHQVAKVLEFQLQHQSFQWLFGLISFRMDWLNFLAAQGTLKSLLQHHSFKSISSSVLSFLYSPTLTSIHGYWKKSLD